MPCVLKLLSRRRNSHKIRISITLKNKLEWVVRKRQLQYVTTSPHGCEWIVVVANEIRPPSELNSIAQVEIVIGAKAIHHSFALDIVELRQRNTTRFQTISATVLPSQISHLPSYLDYKDRRSAQIILPTFVAASTIY